MSAHNILAPRAHYYLVVGERWALCEICKCSMKRNIPGKYLGETDLTKIRVLRKAMEEDKHPFFLATDEAALACQICGRIGPKRAK